MSNPSAITWTCSSKHDAGTKLCWSDGVHELLPSGKAKVPSVFGKSMRYTETSSMSRLAFFESLMSATGRNMTLCSVISYSKNQQCIAPCKVHMSQFAAMLTFASTCLVGVI